MSTNNKPRLVIIISDGPMLVGTPEQVANRPAIHIPVDFPPIPLATIATTIATGVNPVVHGIVTAVTVDGETFQIRDTVASDRCFQAFWTQSGLHTKLINWPATEGDSDVTSYEHSDVFAKAKECLEADVIGMVLPSNVREQSTPDSVREQQQELETFLSSLTHSTRVLLVHKRTNNGGHIPNARLSLCATFLVDGCAHELRRSSYLEVMGGAMYVLSGVSCPMGVKLPQWHFIKALVDCLETRVFPINPKNEETDWLQLIDKISESKNEESIALLNQRFTTLVSVSFKKKLWKELEYNSECLIQLEGKPFERWLKILALHQQDKKEELVTAVDDLCDFYPNIFITRIAKSLLLFEAKPDETLELLKDIDPKKSRRLSRSWHIRKNLDSCWIRRKRCRGTTTCIAKNKFLFQPIECILLGIMRIKRTLNLHLNHLDVWVLAEKSRGKNFGYAYSLHYNLQTKQNKLLATSFR